MPERPRDFTAEARRLGLDGRPTPLSLLRSAIHLNEEADLDGLLDSMLLKAELDAVVASEGDSTSASGFNSETVLAHAQDVAGDRPVSSGDVIYSVISLHEPALESPLSQIGLLRPREAAAQVLTWLHLVGRILLPKPAVVLLRRVSWISLFLTLLAIGVIVYRAFETGTYWWLLLALPVWGAVFPAPLFWEGIVIVLTALTVGPLVAAILLLRAGVVFAAERALARGLSARMGVRLSSGEVRRVLMRSLDGSSRARARRAQQRGPRVSRALTD